MALKMIDALNEETVKVRYVIPFLQRCGFHPNDLLLEATFSVVLGRRQITPPKESGRLDILVRLADRNILVVEVKRDGSPITDENRDQAISYARLVHPVAPFALVTNGSEFHLFDTITKKEVNETRLSPD